MQNALQLLDVDNDGNYDPAELVEVLRSAEDFHLTDEELDNLLLEYTLGSATAGRNTPLHVPSLETHSTIQKGQTATVARRRMTLTLNELKEVLVNGKYRQQESGRQYVLLSLAEAETIRCILHLRQGKSPVQGSDTAMALRCVCSHDIVLDASHNFVAGSNYQRSVAHNSFRFFNSDTHYKPGEVC